MLRHNCKLPNAYVPIEYQHVDSGLCISCRRKTYTFIMINHNHPLASRYYRSSTLRRREQIRHLTNHPYIIHPFSMFTLYWELIYFIACTTMILFLSITTTDASARTFRRLLPFKRVLDAIMMLDILKSFFTGYYSKETYSTVLKPKLLVKHYLLGYFLIDFLPLAPLWILSIRNAFSKNQQIRELFLFSINFEVIRIARLPRCCRTLKTGAQYFNFSNGVSGMITVVYKYFMIIVWLYEVVYYLDEFLVEFVLDKPSRLKTSTQMDDFLSFTRLLLNISDGLTEANHPLEVLQCVVFIGVTYGLTLALYCQIFQEFQKFTNVRRQNETLYREFSLYAQFKGLPITITRKILETFRFKYQNELFIERKIDEILSDNLKEEIQLQIAKDHIRRVEFLRHVPPIVLAQLVTRMKSEVYLSNEVIVTADVPGSCMYFIHYGTVAVYTPTGKEMCHLKDGDHFGEIALIFQELRTATIVAVTHCELFTLKRSDFIEVVNLYPKVKKNVVKMATQRLKMSRAEDPTGEENINDE